MILAYARHYEALDAVMGEAEHLALQTETSDSARLCGLMAEARKHLVSGAPLRIAFIGEFSAGKSSLIAALTGADIKINADVCTTVTREYPWHGVTLVDTPGIQAQQNATDHDRIAREATIGADLVLFVITNELFNPRLANHLRFILDETGLGLARKSALVVNKADRESNPEETLRGEIQKILGPHQDMPIYFCAAAKYLQADNVPAAIKERFLMQSRIPELTEGIDRFVDDAGTLGRLTAPLQIAVDVLGTLQAALTPSDRDRVQLELIRRQRAVLQGLQSRLLEIRKTWKQQAYSTVINLGDAATKQINDLSTPMDLTKEFELGMKQAAGQLDGLHADVAADISAALNEAWAKLDEIGDSPLARELGAPGERGATVGVNFDGESPSGGELAAKFGKAVAKPIQEGLKMAAENAAGIEAVLNRVAGMFNKALEEGVAANAATTIAGVAGAVGKAVPYLALALDFYLQHKKETKKDEKAKYLTNMRIALRHAFADQAALEANHLEANIITVSQGPVAGALAQLDEATAAIAARSSRMDESAKKIACLMERCTRLRNAIMHGVEGEPAAG